MATQPATIVEVAFVTNPFGTLTWTDITSYVRAGNSTRGRNYELGKTSAGTCNLILQNTDGRFDPTNTGSPYYPYVLPLRPIRVRAPYSFAVTDAVTTNTSTTLTSATAGFTTFHTGFTVTGTGIPANTTITYVNATTVTLSHAATASASGVSATFSFTYDVWRGFVERWPQAWALGGTFGTIQLTAVDGMKALLGRVFGLPYDKRVQADYGINGDVNSSWGYWTNETLAAGVLTAAETGYMSASGSVPTALNTTTGASAAIVTGISTNAVQFTAGGVFLSLSSASAPSASGAGEALIRLDTTPAPLAGAFEWLMCSGNQASTTAGAPTFLQIPPLGDHVTPFITSSAAATGSKPTVQCGDGPSIGWWKPPVNLLPSTNVSSFSTDATGWTRLDPAQTTLARDTGQTQPQGGSSTSGKLHGFGSSTSWGIVSASFITGITAGDTYGLTCRAARGANPDLAALIQIDWYTSGGALISSTISGAQTIRTQSASNYFWTNLIVSGTAPATAVKCKIKISPSASSNIGAGDDVWFTDFMLVDTTALDTSLAGLPGSPTVGSKSLAWAAPGDTNTYFFMTTPGVNVNTDNAYSILTTSLPAILTNQWYVLTWATPNITGSAGTAFVRFTPVGGLGANVDLFGLLNNTYNRTVSTNVGNLSWGALTSDLDFTLDDFYLARWSYTSGTAPNVINPNTTTQAQHAIYVAHSTTFPAQTSDVRITAVLDALGWPSADRTIDGSTTALTASGDVTGTTALTLIQDAADATLGNVFVNGAGKIVFQNRAHRNSATPIATFGENTGETQYQGDIVIDFDDTYIYNDVTITGTVNGVAYSANLQDATSINTYGPLSLPTRSLPLTEKAKVDGQAATLLLWYKNPAARIPQVKFEGRAAPGRLVQMLGREIGDLVTVKRRPIGAAVISLNNWIDGVSHAWDANKWETTFMLTPQYPDSTY